MLPTRRFGPEAFCSPASHRRRRRPSRRPPRFSPAGRQLPPRGGAAGDRTAPTHLRDDIGGTAQRDLLAKAPSELSHEPVLAREPLDGGRFRLAVPGIRTRHEFSAAGRFRALVTEALDEYESDHPDLARCLAGGVDLRAGSFRHLCLKRLQLRNALQLVGLGDQTSSPLYAGRMDNPVARAEEARPATVGERGSGLPVRGGVAS